MRPLMLSDWTCLAGRWWVGMLLCVVLLAGCPVGGDPSKPDWSFPDACEEGPPDEACWVDKRVPTSARIALAGEIAARYMAENPAEEHAWDWGEGTLMFSLT